MAGKSALETICLFWRGTCLSYVKQFLALSLTMLLGPSALSGPISCEGIFAPSALKSTSVVYSSQAHRERLINVENKDLETQESTHRSIALTYAYQGTEGFLIGPRDIQNSQMTSLLHQGLGVFRTSLDARLNKGKKDVEDWSLIFQSVDSFRVGFSIVEKMTQTGFQVPVGLIRVFDGSLYHGSKALLPCETFLKEQGVQTDYFDIRRKEGYELIEIGKYFVDRDQLDVSARTTTRNELLTWLSRHYLGNGSEKRIFVIAVGSRAHGAMYEKMFGATPIPAGQFNADLGKGNAILVVDAATLKTKIQRMLSE